MRPEQNWLGFGMRLHTEAKRFIRKFVQDLALLNPRHPEQNGSESQNATDDSPDRTAEYRTARSQARALQTIEDDVWGGGG